MLQAIDLTVLTKLPHALAPGLTRPPPTSPKTVDAGSGYIHSFGRDKSKGADVLLVRAGQGPAFEADVSTSRANRREASGFSSRCPFPRQAALSFSLPPPVISFFFLAYELASPFPSLCNAPSRVLPAEPALFERSLVCGPQRRAKRGEADRGPG